MVGLDMGKLSGVMYDKVTYTTIYIPSILMVHQCAVEEEWELWWKTLQQTQHKWMLGIGVFAIMVATKGFGPSW